MLRLKWVCLVAFWGLAFFCLAFLALLGKSIFKSPLKNSRHTSSKSLCPDRVVLFNLRSFKAVVWLHNCSGWWQFFVRHTLISLHTGSTKLFFPSFAGGAFHDPTLRWFCCKKRGFTLIDLNWKTLDSIHSCGGSVWTIKWIAYSAFRMIFIEVTTW